MDLFLRKVIHPQAHDNYRVILNARTPPVRRVLVWREAPLPRAAIVLRDDD